MKTGLVLEGGAMRGLFTAGILDVLLENDVNFDGMVGVSAGAVMGCNYKSKQIGRAIRYNVKYCKDKRYFGLHSLLTTGDIYGADFCYYELPEKLDIFDSETYINNPIEFHFVCTDVETGEAVYKKSTTLDHSEMEWMRASASMPLVSRIVEVDGRKLLDGGMADSIPLKYFESIGYDRNVVILTQPKGYIKKKTGMISLIKIVMNKYPNMVKALQNRHNMYNDTIKYICEKEEKGEILVIRPKESLPVSRMENNPEKLKATYEIGRQAGLEYLEKIKEFIK